MATLCATTISLLTGSQLEDNLEEMLWSLTSIHHHGLTHNQKLLDNNEFEVRESSAGSSAYCWKPRRGHNRGRCRPAD